MSERKAGLDEFRESVRFRARGMGFILAGFASAEPLPRKYERRWERWLAEDAEHDRAGEMHWLRRPTPRRTHPRDLMPEAQSILVVAAPYFAGDHDSEPTADQSEVSGKVARYAWGEDYHYVLREMLSELGQWIADEAPSAGLAEPVVWRAVTDSAPVDERSLAVEAGLGFVGKNTLLLNPEYGSWFLLAELMLSIPFAADEPLAPGEGTCGSCRLCLEACPTDAFIDAYRLDAKKCISYLTIESREAIPDERAGQLSGWAFGCDICQEVCPFNERALEVSPLERFGRERGAGPWFSEAQVRTVDSNKAFARKWAHTPLARTGRKGMARNLAALGDAD